MATTLNELTAIPGISGHEDEIARFMAAQLRDYAASVSIDSLGNVIARFGAASTDAARQKVAILAHMDTVGLMVKRADEDGLLRVVPVGGVNLKALPGAQVRIGQTPGVIGVRSQHLAQTGDTAVNSADDLYIQVAGGLTAEITAPITYAPQTVTLGEMLYASPYLDNRAGCDVLLSVAREIRRSAASPPSTIYLIGTVQEETTCMGAYHALNTIRPDAAIFVDGTVSYDTPEIRGRGAVALGAGPVLTAYLYVSGLNGWHAHPGLRAHLKATAAGQSIPYQQDAVQGLMSDARAASMLGIPSAIIGLPIRGKHSPLEIIALDDLANAVRLLTAALSHPLPELKRG